MSTAVLRRRGAAIPVLLGLLSLVIAFVQDPGVVVADTKVNLYVDPVRFLSAVTSAWTPTTTLGHVFSGQYEGYLVPMAPFFAAGHALAIPMWVTQRLWLAALLALGAAGVVALMDVVADQPRGLGHLVAGAMFVLNPYVVTLMDRTSISLLAYGLTPWMLYAVHRGLHDPRGWRWPAVLALIVAASGGGVNAGVIAWVLLAPVMLLVYERCFGEVGPGAVGPYLARAIPLGVLASLWWLVGLAVNGTHGPNILQFTEQPGAIWGTTSLTESLRLMGYWPSYFGLSYLGPLKPYYSSSAPLLFSRPVLAATLVVPGLALGALPWTLRRPWTPFLLSLVLVGLLVMEAGFPNGTLLRHGLSFTYYHLAVTQALRTSYKAGPLVAVGLACLGGLGASQLRDALARSPDPAARPARPWITGAAVVILGALLLAGDGWPLLQGRGLDAALALPHGVPSAWTDAAHTLDDTLPADTRAMVLPGQLFGFYSWGGTVDPILPQITRRPVVERGVTPYADLRADDLQWATDALVSQGRAVPGQLSPLLNLMGVGAVVSAADGDLTRSGEISPADAARTLAGQGFGRPSAEWGPRVRVAAQAGELAGPATLPEVRLYRVPTGGMIRVLPHADPTILDGDGSGITELAAFGRLHPGRALRYAADLTPTQMRAAAAAGADLVVTDSNRRQVFVTSSIQQNAGPVIGPGDPFSPDSAVLDPFPAAGSDAQTVQVVGGGISDVRALVSPGFPQFPEHGPFAALDGDPATAWIADRHLQTFQRWLRVSFPRARDVPWVALTPYQSPRARVFAVTIGGRRFAVHDGVNRLPVDLHHVTSLMVTLTGVTHPQVEAGGGGGITELRIPGTDPTEALRPPVLLEHALRGRDLSRDSLTYLFSRQTGDDPFARQPVEPEPELGQVDYPGDAEAVLSRAIDLPAARRFTARAWVGAAVAGSDAALDRLVGVSGPDVFTSSSRFADRPSLRASSAFVSGTQGWVGEWTPGLGDWIAVSSRRPLTVSRLRLGRSPLPVRVPTVVRVSWPGGSTGRLRVGHDGTVVLSRPVTARALRISIVASRPGRPGLRAVGIGRVLGIAGLGRVSVPHAGPLPAGCDGPVLRVGGHVIGLALRGTIQALDAGRPLRAVSCGPPVALAAGAQTLRGVPGPLSVDLLALVSPAPAATPAPTGGGSVIRPGVISGGSVTGASVRVHGPSWLELGESYDPGWRASCDGHSLGTPVALQGYGNGWPLSRGCRTLSFRFAPDSELAGSDWISAAVCAALLALLLGGAVTRRRRGDDRPSPGRRGRPDVVERPAGRWGPRAALGAAVAGVAVLGFTFALRAGIVLGPLLGLALWRGLPARWATRLAAVLLVIVVPAIYVLHPVADLGGFNPNYANAQIDAHFVAVLAWCALAYALVRSLGDRRAARRAAREPF